MVAHLAGIAYVMLMFPLISGGSFPHSLMLIAVVEAGACLALIVAAGPLMERCRHWAAEWADIIAEVKACRS